MQFRQKAITAVPHIATGVSFKLGAQRTIMTKIMCNWRDGSPSSTGVAFGFKQGF